MSIQNAFGLAMLVTCATIVHADQNRYRVASAPEQPATLVVMTEYAVEDGEAEPYAITITAIGRVVASSDGVPTVAYRLGRFHALDGLEHVVVHTALGEVTISTAGAKWLEVPASPSRRPVSVCYRVRGNALPRQDVETHDVFGTQQIRTGRPESLCVPTTIAFPGDAFYYYPAYGVAFPPPPDGPARLCLEAQPAKPVLMPPPMTVTTTLGEAPLVLDGIREHCVPATVTIE